MWGVMHVSLWKIIGLTIVVWIISKSAISGVALTRGAHGRDASVSF